MISRGNTKLQLRDLPRQGHYTTCRMYHVPQMSHAPTELLYGMHGLMQRGIPHTVKSSDCQIKHFLLASANGLYN